MEILRFVAICLYFLNARNPFSVFASLPDVSHDVFGGYNMDIFPVAFGDYDSDKMTDVVVLNKDFSSFDIYFGESSPPVLRTRQGFQCDLKFTKQGKEQPIQIIGLQLADFTGDGVTDICVSFVLKDEPSPILVTIFKGNISGLDCQNSAMRLSKSSQYLYMKQEPLIVDINGDMVADLLGEDETSGGRRFWTFYKDGQLPPEEIDFQCDPILCLPFANPSANSFTDIDNDFQADLLIISTKSFPEERKSEFYIEIFSIEETNGIPRVKFEKMLPLSTEMPISRIGNPIFMDMNSTGDVLQIIPFCSNSECYSSGFLIVENEKVSRLDIKFQDNEGNQWGFLVPQLSSLYNATISFRVGDFNLDGYPDLVGTLKMVHKSKLLSQPTTRPVLFINVPCDTKSCKYNRTFHADFYLLQNHNGSINTAFFDVYEDGLLDIMIVREVSGTNDKFGVFLHKNNPEYDAYFIKWIMTTGLCETNCPPYGVRIPGASILYNTTDHNGNPQSSRASQIYRPHFAMDLPYTVMGTGTSSNFIEAVVFGLSRTKNNTWFQIIPNSILIVIPPYPGSYRWQIKQLLTPSVNGAMPTFQVLLLICFLNGSIVFYFWLKERKEDKIERRNSPLVMCGLAFT